ncbi:MAG: aldo/keto reductase [Halobacteriota archaeon]|uniref:aldo/keto reductase n=1 Tax=Natronomonas sp. TaxID=2184060 RepID=UPI003974EA44
MPDSSLPRIGLGTVSDDPPEWTEAVRTALEIGYRHIDTAQMYDNEEYVGEGIRASSIDGEEVFVATKTVYPDGPDHPEGVRDAIDGSVDRLGLDSVDLCYVHWPSDVYEPETVLPQFDEAREDGTIDRVGVCNFTPDLLDEAREILDAPLTAHQVEFHPLLQQDELLEYAQEHDHWLVAYCPIARGRVYDVPEVREIAEKHDATPAQVSLAWLLSKDNVAVIPKSSGEAHQRENLAAADIALDGEDVATIDSLEYEERIIDPDHGPWNW